MQDLHHILRKTEKIGANLSFTSTDRKFGAACLFDLSHEHAKAIMHLVDLKLGGSAFALLRPCIEAYIRGSWLLYCATDDQVEKFTSERNRWPKLVKQMNQLAEHHNRPAAFDRYKGETMGVLDGLTHGLSIQIKRRYNNGSIEFLLDEDDITDLYRETGFASIMSTLGLANISENKEAVKSLEALFDDLNF